jgi:tetratricopeptide (TPR) repeat protein
MIKLPGSPTLIIMALLSALLFGSCATQKGSQSKVRSLAYDSTYYESLLFEAKKQQMLENPQKALELYEEISRLNPGEAVAHYELGRLHLSEGRNAKALECGIIAAQLEPQNKWYHLLNADIMMQLGRFTDAADEIAKAIKLDEKDPDLYLQHATALTYAGKYKEAVRSYDKVESLYGINEDVSFEKHRLYLAMRDADGARRELEKLIESNPAEPRYYGALAEFHVRMGNKEKAVEYFNKVLEVDPGNPQVRVSLADYYRQQGNDKQAYSEMMAAFQNPRLDIDSKIRILLTYYSVTETATRYKKEAYSLLDTLVSLYPQEAKVWSVYGDFLLRDQRKPEALAMFSKVLEIDSTRFPVWEQILLLQTESGNPGQLISLGGRAVSLFPEQPLPYLSQSIGLLRAKRYEEAIKVLERGLFFVSDDKMRVDFLIHIAQSNYELGKKEKAYGQFDQILEADPRNVLVLNNYAYFLALDSTNLPKAKEMAALACNIQPANATYLDTYAWVLFRQGNFAEALPYIELSMASGGIRDATVIEHYGDILYHLNRRSEALRYWKEAELKDPGNPRLRQKVKTGEYHE